MQNTDSIYSHYVRTALNNVQREYPNSIQHFILSEEETDSSGGFAPSKLHPIFFGSYDWHSCVHMHWALLRMLNLMPQANYVQTISEWFDHQFDTEKTQRELVYFERKGASHWQRPYGWGWALRLYAELMICTHPHAPAWREGLRPLADYLADAMYNHMETAPAPVRHGVHSNTAFGMIQALHYARVVSDEKFATLLADTAQRWFGRDRDYRLAYDFSAEDFLSPALTEALLMAQALPHADFLPWFDAFLPELKAEDYSYLDFVRVLNEDDAKQVHNHGLNLSRAWCMRGVMAVLDTGDARWRRLGELSGAHRRSAEAAITGGSYVSTHWLISYALLADTEYEP